MVTHYRLGGHIACGRHGDNIISTTELGRVKCRNCRNTDAFKEARKTVRNAARRAARKARTAHASSDWRASWQQRLTDMPGPQRLPRGFHGQPFV
jgi:ArsR family metal-binding transcriptional regulator